MRLGVIVGLGVLGIVALLVGMTVYGAASSSWTTDIYSTEGHAGRSIATCSSGDVSLGSQPGIINFSANCQAPHSGGVVRFDLIRYSVHDPRHPGILKFSRRPHLTGPGVGGQYGACMLRQNVLGCHARANGRVRVSGKIWVPRARRCAKRIVLEVILPPQCNHEECLAAARVKVLAKGRPRGC